MCKKIVNAYTFYNVNKQKKVELPLPLGSSCDDFYSVALSASESNPADTYTLYLSVERAFDNNCSYCRSNKMVIDMDEEEKEHWQLQNGDWVDTWPGFVAHH